MKNIETVYLSFEQVSAVQEAIKEIAINSGVLNDSIKVVNSGKGKASWMEVAPTDAKYLFWLGMKTGRILHDQSQSKFIH